MISDRDRLQNIINYLAGHGSTETALVADYLQAFIDDPEPIALDWVMTALDAIIQAAQTAQAMLAGTAPLPPSA
jgi:hypothetical protein